jgi:hypothetical protein
MVAAAVGTVGAVASIGGSMISADASKSAAKTQANSAAAAELQQAAEFQQTRADIAPFRQGGQQGLTELLNQMPGLDANYNNGNPYSGNMIYNGGKPFDMSTAGVEDTAGYKFNMDQGLRATQSAAAARGLGVSGAALKAAGGYASGLADSTYQNQANNYYAGAQNYQAGQVNASNAYYAGANNYYAGQTNAYNKLFGTAGLGESAASQTGTLGQQAATNQTALITGAGNSIASGQIGAGNAISGGLTGAANSLSNTALMNKLLTQQAAAPAAVPQTLFPQNTDGGFNANFNNGGSR